MQFKLDERVRIHAKVILDVCVREEMVIDDLGQVWEYADKFNHVDGLSILSRLDNVECLADDQIDFSVEQAELDHLRRLKVRVHFCKRAMHSIVDLVEAPKGAESSHTVMNSIAQGRCSLTFCYTVLQGPSIGRS